MYIYIFQPGPPPNQKITGVSVWRVELIFSPYLVTTLKNKLLSTSPSFPTKMNPE